ncbi:MAG: penicillin-binding protein [Candidatus Nealsonbacteria bacterium CG_4_10_14_0_2_um_filter_40_15]|uniref:Penicillin-binding protein n=1 Tax=Candidatus Nealsonbacteria bacterium CG_4_10_14_0_2_um_filter_40_15 TaxID=1974682 RepID=A0A2M7UUT5_9BACT|nr:MAG: penicillin-binding protein [Candidatus Nealsonbacteria bacterium CG_4_10_14_0_2_um_filter_40_15]
MRKHYKILSQIAFWGIIFIFTAVTLFIFVFFYYSRRLPDPNAWQDRKIIQSTKIYDREGKNLLYEIHGEEKRTVIPFNEIPQTVKNATMVAEDEQFYQHLGVNIRGILRAILADIKGGTLTEGGSSITQQLIKNAYLSPERTFTRKIKELVLSIELERRYSKDEILNFYLNQIPYGSNSYGIEAAAQTYFNKPAKELTLTEAVYLAVMPKAPSYYSPYGNHREELKSRANYILNRMHELKYISDNDYNNAKKMTVNFVGQKTDISAPHFVMFIRDYLNEKYGEDFVEKGGLKVTTTLNLDFQKIANTVVKDGAKRNEIYNAKNAALVAINPKTGQILAMVGSKNYNGDPEPEGCEPGRNCQFEPNVNVATRLRQPGSSFKPFVYATAINKGYTPDTIIWDIPTEFNPQCSWTGVAESGVDQQTCYKPKNYDGRFRGPVTLKQALANSLNVPSVKVLYLAGINDSIDTAENLGISTLKDRSRYGLSLVLGAAEVKLLDIVSAYGVFGQEGTKRKPTGILKIEDGGGRVLEEYKDQNQKMLSEQTAREINDILSDNAARAPMFGLYSPLSLGDRPVAAKTGTTQDPNDETKAKDAWMIGYTPSLAAGVWTGNNNNSPIEKGGAGVAAAGPIWHDFMTQALKDAPIETFNKPDPIITDKPILNGQRQIHEILYWLNKNNPQGAPPEEPSSDPQFKNWEASLQNWLKLN